MKRIVYTIHGSTNLVSGQRGAGHCLIGDGSAPNERKQKKKIFRMNRFTIAVWEDRRQKRNTRMNNNKKENSFKSWYHLKEGYYKKCDFIWEFVVWRFTFYKTQFDQPPTLLKHFCRAYSSTLNRRRKRLEQMMPWMTFI